MSNNLAEVWHEVEALLNQGVSVIPVRDKDDFYNGKTFAAKTPYKKWEKYQTEIIDRAVLWHEMQERNTTAIAMVCGAVSGNLEVIDFDVKYKPGIDAVVIHAINDLYPDILAKIRVHKTPSGGTHLIYRITDHEVPPSTHLANRPATDEEIANTKNKKKYRTFIETRGTGSLATAPPSLGYTIRKNIPIQQLTWEERCVIIELCKAYNEYYPEQKPYTPPKTEIAYYDENPFEHYNRTVDPVELLTEFGWTYVKKNGDYIWFTRPGGRRGDVHAGFNLTNRTYRVWGTKVDLESDRSYTPTTILAHYRFNQDKSLTYAHLVQLGYGRIKPTMERQLIRRRALQGLPMPNNASAEAVQQYQEQVAQLAAAHPYGIYWQPDAEHDDKMIISRLAFKEVATGLGFRLYRQEIVQIDQQFVHRRELRHFFDCMRTYIKEQDADLYENIYNATQAFLERHGKFESTQLDFIDEELILQDTRTTCYKFYQNGYVLINVHSYSLYNYDTISDKLIWYEKIQSRDYVPVIGSNSSDNELAVYDRNVAPTGLYTSYLRLACDYDNNREHIQKIIGWLAHDYKDTTTGYIITLVERCADPKDGGGSGKNLFCELLSYTTTYGSMAAGQKRSLDGTTLLQSWKGERVFALSDVNKDFDFGMLKEPATGKAVLKKLFKDEYNLNVKDVPKFIVLTNFSYDVSDGGLKRRIIALEFTNFFTECGGVDKHFGKYFPDDWSADDWADYDDLICKSVQLWMAGGLKLQPIELSETGWEKQFIYTYGTLLHDFFTEYWPQWMRDTFVPNQEFNRQLEAYMVENGISTQKFKPSSPKINKALKEWCNKNRWSVVTNEVQRGMLVTERGRKFYEEPPF